ncbi:hypothetical protein L1987_51284 [Smallanthus sonchifolius]|uniref:Uncharacterized protein n=1 Tax=Smallanthus sonchifolius TaxID=185202 RepID=A0ACB9EP99_9ASTR|nr:hypothetical protein L1987_51284 [Smallanthus sonchifolius]
MGSFGASLWQFDSPLIYLFGGIFVILGLITTALMILVCSQRKHRFGDDGSEDIERGDDEHKAVTVVCHSGDCVDVSPKLVVIMAGDEVPTYLATPCEVITDENRVF